MDPVLQWAMRLSDEISSSQTAAAFKVIGEAIDRLVPGDTGGMVHTERSGEVSIVGNPHPDIGKDLTAILARTLPLHPQVQSYLANPLDLSPRRISDLLPGRDWSRHPVYRELFVPLGARYQLSIVVRPFTANGGGDGWAVNRSAADFSDSELDTAGRIQPVLVTLHRAHELQLMRAPSSTIEHQVPVHRRLTAREADILSLVSQGFTAVQIAHIRRISPRTVRKHLQNTYEKLDCHDRLLAVRRAQQVGLIRPER